MGNQKKIFQAEKMSCIKALRQEQAWCMQGRTRARRLVWPECVIEGGAVAKEMRQVWGIWSNHAELMEYC